MVDRLKTVPRHYRRHLEEAERRLKEASDLLVKASRYSPSMDAVRGIALVRGGVITAMVGTRELAGGALPDTDDVPRETLERGAGEELDLDLEDRPDNPHG